MAIKPVFPLPEVLIKSVQDGLSKSGIALFPEKLDISLWLADPNPTNLFWINNVADKCKTPEQRSRFVTKFLASVNLAEPLSDGAANCKG